MAGVDGFRSLEEYRQWLRMFRLFRDYPIGLIRERGLVHLPRIRGKVGGSYYLGLVDDWERALRDPDPSRMRTLALDVSQYGVDMRQINPFQGVMTPEDVAAVVRDLREHWRRGGA